MDKEDLKLRLNELKEQLSYAVLGNKDGVIDTQALIDFGTNKGRNQEKIEELRNKLNDDNNYLSVEYTLDVRHKAELDEELNEIELSINSNNARLIEIDNLIATLNRKIERSTHLLEVAQQNNNNRAISRNNFELNRNRKKLEELTSESVEIENRLIELTDLQSSLSEQSASISLEKEIDQEARSRDIMELDSLERLDRLYSLKSTVINYDTISEIDKTISLIDSNALTNEQLIDRLKGIQEDIPVELLTITQEQKQQEIAENNETLINLSGSIASLQDKTANKENYRYSAFDLEIIEDDVMDYQDQIDDANKEIDGINIQINYLNYEFAILESQINSHEESITNLEGLNQNLGRRLRRYPEETAICTENININVEQIQRHRELKESKLKILANIKEQRETLQSKLSNRNKTKDTITSLQVLKKAELERKTNGYNELMYNDDLRTLDTLKNSKLSVENRNKFLGYDIGLEFFSLIEELKNPVKSDSKPIIEEQNVVEDKPIAEETKMEEKTEESTVNYSAIEDQLLNKQAQVRQMNPDESIQDYLDYLAKKEEEIKNLSKISDDVSSLTPALAGDEIVPVNQEEQKVLPVPVEKYESTKEDLIKQGQKKSFISKAKEWAKKHWRKVALTVAAAIALITIAVVAKSCNAEADFTKEDLIDPDNSISQEEFDEINAGIDNVDIPSIDEITPGTPENDENTNVVGDNVVIDTPVQKSNYDIALEVIAGKWGKGSARKEALTAAGYDYEAIRSIVNDLMDNHKNDNTVNEVIVDNDVEDIDEAIILDEDVEDLDEGMENVYVTDDTTIPIYQEPVLDPTIPGAVLIYPSNPDIPITPDIPSVPDTPTIPVTPITPDVPSIPSYTDSNIHLEPGETVISANGWQASNGENAEVKPDMPQYNDQGADISDLNSVTNNLDGSMDLSISEQGNSNLLKPSAIDEDVLRELEAIYGGNIDISRGEITPVEPPVKSK